MKLTVLPAMLATPCLTCLPCPATPASPSCRACPARPACPACPALPALPALPGQTVPRVAAMRARRYNAPQINMSQIAIVPATNLPFAKQKQQTEAYTNNCRTRDANKFLPAPCSLPTLPTLPALPTLRVPPCLPCLPCPPCRRFLA